MALAMLLSAILFPPPLRHALQKTRNCVEIHACSVQKAEKRDHTKKRSRDRSKKNNSCCKTQEPLNSQPLLTIWDATVGNLDLQPSFVQTVSKCERNKHTQIIRRKHHVDPREAVVNDAVSSAHTCASRMVPRHFVACPSIFSAVFARGPSAGWVHRLGWLRRSLSSPCPSPSLRFINH